MALPKSRKAFSLQLLEPRQSLTDMSRVCLIGESKPCWVDIPAWTVSVVVVISLFFPMYLSMSKLFISASSCFLQEYLIHSWPVYNCFCPNNFTKCTSHEWLLLFITFLFFKKLITSQITYGMYLFHCHFLLAYLPQLFRYEFCVYDILGHIIIIIRFGISPINLPSMWIQWIYLLCGLLWIQFYWSHSFLFSFCPVLISVSFLI